MSAVNKMLGDRNDDEALAFMSEMADTYDQSHNPDSEDWERKYRENDEAWRQRYRERFMSPTIEKEEDIEDVKETKKVKTFEDLFKSEV